MLLALLALSVAGPVPEGETTLALTAGKPFYSVRVDHGLTQAFEAGVGLDVATSGFLRPVLRSRLRLFGAGALRVSLRAAAALVIPVAGSGYGPRPVVRTGDGELGLNLDFPILPRLWAFGELSVLGESDGKVEHSAALGQALAGLELATDAAISLVARGGVLQGARARAAVYSGGVVFHF